MNEVEGSGMLGTAVAHGKAGHLRVEWSPEFWGEGDFHGETQVAYIPLSMIEQVAASGASGDDGVDIAFGKVTHQDPIHILSYTFDEVYDEEGELVETDTTH